MNDERSGRAETDFVTRLATLDACAVSDALERLGLQGSVLGIHALYPFPRIAGRAVTVKLVPQGFVKSSRHLCTTAIEAAAPGDIIVVDHGGRCDCAGWGGILSTAAKTKGIGGVAINPSDFVIADASGVVFVAKERVEEIIAAAEQIAAREAEMTKDVLAGASVVEVMGKTYESMLDRKK